MRTQFQTIASRMCALVLCISATTQLTAEQISDIAMVPRLTIQGTPGAINQIQYCTNLNQPDWLVLTNVVVTETNYWVVDVNAPPAPGRFYRVVVLTVPVGMALIPAGYFTMGNCMDPNEGDSSELPLHTVYVSSFFMEQYLVTSNLWWTVKAWSAGNGYSYDNAGSGKTNNHPVYGINWYDTVKWCNARSQQEGLVPCYYTDGGFTVVYKIGQVAPYVNWAANGYRLPTEAEWEKAARGGASGHRFPWSDTDTISHSRANYSSVGVSGYDLGPTPGYDPTFNDGVFPYSSPVGYYAANGYGLYDMAGNMMQWCWDRWADGWYSNPGATQNDTRGPSSGLLDYHVRRSGSWYSNGGSSRCAYRTTGSASNNQCCGIQGFRCARGL